MSVVPLLPQLNVNSASELGQFLYFAISPSVSAKSARIRSSRLVYVFDTRAAMPFRARLITIFSVSNLVTIAVRIFTKICSIIFTRFLIQKFSRYRTTSKFLPYRFQLFQYRQVWCLRLRLTPTLPRFRRLLLA